MPRNHVDVATLTDEQIRDGVRTNGHYWGSHPDYINDEIARCLRDRAGVRAYLDDVGKLRVYYRAPAEKV